MSGDYRVTLRLPGGLVELYHVRSVAAFNGRWQILYRRYFPNGGYLVERFYVPQAVSELTVVT